MEKEYSILTFYCYTSIAEPYQEVKRHQLFLKNLDAKARIYIAYNGINAQMSLSSSDAKIYLDWLQSNERFSSLVVKIDAYHEHVFPRLTVKFRRQLVALDVLPDLTSRGTYVSPKEWKTMLENRDETTFLLDVRNDYESKIGHFEGAKCPQLKCFRDFPKYAEELAKGKDVKKTKIMMYCTGGIRCETYSALLKEKGFEQIYQLEGGVLHYGHEVGSAHWKGKLFVFDDRLSIPISNEDHELISHCDFCECKTDRYYNCANMDCNHLFLCCLTCIEKLQGCCCVECSTSSWRRPYVEQERPKPFKKWYHYDSLKRRKKKEIISNDQ